MSVQSQPQLFKEVLPKTGMVFTEETLEMVLCKPKILPLKSVTLEKLEQMQTEAQEKLRGTATSPEAAQ
ncbi:hypothetical protein EMCRGX_G012497 [Ephydatia muelleri]